MMGLFEAAWVIARRDFIATVYSRTFIIFLLMPLLMIGVATIAGQAGERADREDGLLRGSDDGVDIRHGGSLR